MNTVVWLEGCQEYVTLAHVTRAVLTTSGNGDLAGVELHFVNGETADYHGDDASRIKSMLKRLQAART